MGLWKIGIVLKHIIFFYPTKSKEIQEQFKSISMWFFKKLVPNMSLKMRQDKRSSFLSRVTLERDFVTRSLFIRLIEHFCRSKIPQSFW